jgi:hypothetical protein
MSHVLTNYGSTGILICTNPDGSETGLSDAGLALNDNFKAVVPYNGAESDVNLGSQALTPGRIILNAPPTFSGGKFIVGGSNYASCSASAFPLSDSARTISFTVNTVSTFAFIFAWGTETTGGRCGLFIYPDGISLDFYGFAEGDKFAVNLSMPTTMVITYDGGTTVKYYVNGSLAHTSTVSATPATASGNFYVGGAFNPAFTGMSGSISNFAVWSTNIDASGDADAIAISNGANPFTQHSANIVGYWPLASDLNDHSGNSHTLTLGGASGPSILSAGPSSLDGGAITTDGLGTLCLHQQSTAPAAILGGIYFDGANFNFCSDGINWVALTIP